MATENNQLSLDEMIQLAEKIKDWKFSKDPRNGGRKGDECYKGTFNNMEVIIGKVECVAGGIVPAPSCIESYIKVVLDGNEVGNYREKLRDLFSNKNRKSLHNLERLYSSIESERMKNLRVLTKTG